MSYHDQRQEVCAMPEQAEKRRGYQPPAGGKNIEGGYQPSTAQKPLSEGYQPSPSPTNEVKPPPPPANRK
jgi:hypothetical protein